jgi:Fe-Mn family superoxide dismutase
MQKYTAKNYNHLQNIGQISNEAMQMHFKLYEGYVNNVNLLLERCNFLKEKLKLSSCEPCEVVEYNEIHRRFSWQETHSAIQPISILNVKISRGPR